LRDESLKLLLETPLAGNVRELRNLMERAVVWIKMRSSPCRICREQFQTRAGFHRRDGLQHRMTLREIERMYILATLRECGGSRKKAIETLGT